MAEKTNVPRLNMRHGIVLTSRYAGKKIKDIRLPELDQKYFILTPDALEGENTLDFAGSVMPVMAKDEILYEEEPILAVIAPDFESAEIVRRAIEVIPGDDITLDNDGIYQEEYGWGNIEDFRLGWKEVIKKEVPVEKEEESSKGDDSTAQAEGKQEESTAEEKKEESETIEQVIMHEYRKIESTYSMDPVKYESVTYFLSTCWQEGAVLHVMVPTAYPEFIRDTVSRVTGYDKKRILIHVVPYYDICDEYLIYPAVITAIAASAALKLKCPVELKARTVNRRGAVRTKRITYLSNEYKILAEEVVHTVDVGSYLMLERELEREAMTGIIPSYNLQAFKGTVKVEKTFSFPSFLFLSLGYSEAVASTEYHSNIIAEELGMNPYEFRLYAYKDKRKFTDYLPAIGMQDIKKLLTDTAMKSSYSRKWSSNDLRSSDSSFLGYTKGIGIASAIGIAGFSTTFSSQHEYQGKITYTQRGAIVVDISAYSRGTTQNFWKKIITDELGLESEDSVLFSSPEHNNIDSGPKTLSRFISSVSKQLKSSARKLNGMKDTEKLPISITFDAEDKFFPCEFDESGFGAMAIEVTLADSSFIPEVKEVWASYSVGDVANLEILVNSIKVLIIRTLKENGMAVSSSTRVNISVSKSEGESIAAVVSLTRGLVMSALTSALEQAIGEKVILPVRPKEIYELRGKRE